MLDARENLSNNLRQLLASKPKSRLDQSRDIEVPDGTLGRILYKTGNPTLDSIERIAQHFRVGVWQLFLPDLGSGFVATKTELSDEVTPAVGQLIEAAKSADGVPSEALAAVAVLLRTISAGRSGESDLLPNSSLPHGSERQRQIAALHREAIEAGDVEAAKVFERLMQMTAPGKRADKSGVKRRATTKG